MTPRRPISDAEQEALKVLWTGGPATARDVLEALTADGRTWAYTTVKTLLDRLEAKGYVVRNRRDAAHVFTPSIDRDEFMQTQLRTLRDELFGGEATPLVHAVLDGLDLSREEIDELRASLDEMSRSKRRRKR